MKTKKPKGFFARLTDKLDKKLEAKAKKTKCCCCCKDDKCSKQ
jgi:hypothetical protein